MAYEICGAKRRQGGGAPCTRPAGWGTSHLGYGSCKLHGGNTQSGIKAAARQHAAAEVATYGLSREIDPHDALLEELHRTAGHVAWLQQHISTLKTEDLTHLIVVNDGEGSCKTEVIDERANVFIDLYRRERKHFADVAKTCIGVGIAERQVHLAEQQGAMIAQVLRGVLADLGVADRPEVPEVVRRHLTLIAGQAA